MKCSAMIDRCCCGRFFGFDPSVCRVRSLTASLARSVTIVLTKPTAAVSSTGYQHLVSTRPHTRRSAAETNTREFKVTCLGVHRTEYLSFTLQCGDGCAHRVAHDQWLSRQPSQLDIQHRQP